jgi:hypothetical protein
MSKDQGDWVEKWTKALTILGFVMLIVILLGMFAACLRIGHQLTR